MKQKTKRILAFAMAVVFALSTCVTSSPYTVMATEAGETIAPLAEEGSGSGAVTPGTTETGTPGESGEGSTEVIPSGDRKDRLHHLHRKYQNQHLRHI